MNIFLNFLKAFMTFCFEVSSPFEIRRRRNFMFLQPADWKCFFASQRKMWRSAAERISSRQCVNGGCVTGKSRRDDGWEKKAKEREFVWKKWMDGEEERKMLKFPEKKRFRVYFGYVHSSIFTTGRRLFMAAERSRVNFSDKFRMCVWRGRHAHMITHTHTLTW